ncbi:unnamed protein product [Adineta steineri]|uniref:Uncharacterized protein n=1 Tax=Adineta steineri TaxID=433720 RepID=A0A813XS39_9BILA|nr:unnamed protein product [Adineta steineri]CAF3852856.1 unnamed protein product [Adineta steineri]
MAHALTFNDQTLQNEETGSLHPYVGYLLVNYLKGLDVINYMEAVNGSEQLPTIVISEFEFYEIFMELIKKENVTITMPYLDFYLEECSFTSMGYLYPNHYHHEHAPVMRSFIHCTFTVEALEKLCCAYKNPSFQCYSRLLTFNSQSYAGNLILLDYFNYKYSTGPSRELNVYEQSLFKECQLFRPLAHDVLNKNLIFVEHISEFIMNFEDRFKLFTWIKAIDFNKFHISGGCIVNCLCKHPFSDTVIEMVDINFNGNSFHEFNDAVHNIYVDLMKIMSEKNYSPNTTLVKKSNGGYIIELPFNIQLQFNFKNVPNNTNPISYVLHSSDIDVSQVAFTGTRLFCTFAFLQAIATKSFICYTMHATMMKNICERIIRYCHRGFIFLESHDFDDTLYGDIMNNDDLEENRVETKEIIDDDGEVQIMTTTYGTHRWPLPTIDSYLLQEAFIKRIGYKQFE